MGILWRKSGLIERDNNDLRAIGALAYFFDGGTTTPRKTYSDAALSTPRTSPVVADGSGRWPAVYLGFNSYDEKILTAAGSELSYFTNIPNDAPTNPSDTVDTDALLKTGEVFFKFTQGTRAGAVRANGRTMSNGAGAGTERANDDCSALYTELYNSLSNTQAPVIGGRSGSPSTDFAAGKPITLPDLRGGLPIGLDDMGNSAASRMGAVPFTNGGATTAGSLAGENAHTLTSAEAPAHTHAISVATDSQGAHTHTFAATSTSAGSHTHTATVTDPTHFHTQNVTSGNVSITDGAGTLVMRATTTGTTTGASATGVTVANSTDGAHTHDVSGNTGSNGAHTHTAAGTSASTGGGGSHNNMPLGLTGTWYIRL